MNPKMYFLILKCICLWGLTSKPRVTRTPACNCFLLSAFCKYFRLVSDIFSIYLTNSLMSMSKFSLYLFRFWGLFVSQRLTVAAQTWMYPTTSSSPMVDDAFQPWNSLLCLHWIYTSWYVDIDICMGWYIDTILKMLPFLILGQKYDP